MVNLNIGQKIQRYRNQRGLSLRGLAEKTGITASMISQIENNSVNPSINTLKTLAETLEMCIRDRIIAHRGLKRN